MYLSTRIPARIVARFFLGRCDADKLVLFIIDRICVNRVSVVLASCIAFKFLIIQIDSVLVPLLLVLTFFLVAQPDLDIISDSNLRVAVVALRLAHKLVVCPRSVHVKVALAVDASGDAFVFCRRA